MQSVSGSHTLFSPLRCNGLKSFLFYRLNKQIYRFTNFGGWTKGFIKMLIVLKISTDKLDSDIISPNCEEFGGLDKKERGGDETVNLLCNDIE